MVVWNQGQNRNLQDSKKDELEYPVSHQIEKTATKVGTFLDVVLEL